MKINNQIEVEATVQFQDLAVGEVYEDEGVICIKTSDQIGESCYGRCLYYDDVEWREEEEPIDKYVKPVDATITLHGYKRKAR